MYIVQTEVITGDEVYTVEWFASIPYPRGVLFIWCSIPIRCTVGRFRVWGPQHYNLVQHNYSISSNTSPPRVVLGMVHRLGLY